MIIADYWGGLIFYLYLAGKGQKDNPPRFRTEFVLAFGP